MTANNLTEQYSTKTKWHPCAVSVKMTDDGRGYVITYCHLVEDGICERCAEDVSLQYRP